MWRDLVDHNHSSQSNRDDVGRFWAVQNQNKLTHLLYKDYNELVDCSGNQSVCGTAFDPVP